MNKCFFSVIFLCSVINVLINQHGSLFTSSNLSSPDIQEVSSSCWTVGTCLNCSFSRKIWKV